jgi:hypothetical protein
VMTSHFPTGGRGSPHGPAAVGTASCGAPVGGGGGAGPTACAASCGGSGPRRWQSLEEKKEGEFDGATQRPKEDRGGDDGALLHRN